MNWTKTPPTEPGKYYWRRPGFDWKCLMIEEAIDGKLIDEQNGIMVAELAGEWGGRVPAPGTFTLNNP